MRWVLLTLLLVLLLVGLLQAQGVPGARVAVGPLAAPVPVVTTHPLVRGMLDWFRVTPPWGGGPRWYSLLSPRSATLTNMGTGTASGWQASTRVSGQGEMRLDGSDDVLVLPASAYPFTASAAYTWAFWIRPQSFAAFSGLWTALAAGPGDESTGALYLVAHTNTGTYVVTAGLVAGYHSDSGNDLVQASLDNVLSLGTLAHVVFTYDGAASQANRFQIYVNGGNVNNNATVVSTGTVASFTASVVQIGHDTFGTDAHWQGAMDDVQVYTRALASAEVAQLYRLSLQGWPGVLRRQSDLVALVGAPTAAPGGAGKGRFFPFLWPEQRR